MPIPALAAAASMGARLGAAPPMCLPCTEAADTRSALKLRQPPQVFAASIYKEVPHTTHKAQPEAGGPHLWRERKTAAVLRQTSQIHFTIEIENLTALVGGEGDATAVNGDGA